MTKDNHRCGYGSFTPQWLQKFHKAPCLLINLSLMALVQGAVVNGCLFASISTLERRFQLTSTQMGMVAGMYDLASMIIMIPVGYYGGKSHMGRLLAIGMIVMICGSITFVLPQFFEGLYEITEASYDTNTTLCTLHSSDVKLASTANQSNAAFYIFLLGQCLHGLGCAPMFTLAFVYLDDNVEKVKSSLYTGIFYGFAFLGPAVGFLLSAVFLNIYGDFLRVDTDTLPIDSEHDLWYGAWWIGYLFVSVIAVLVVIPLFSFARRLPAPSIIQEPPQEMHINQAADIADAVSTDNSPPNVATTTPADPIEGHRDDLAGQLKSLISNPVYVLLVLSDTVDAAFTIGTATFMSKFIENQFSKSSSTAALFSGAILIPTASISSMLSGIILRYFKFELREMLRFCAVVSLISIAFTSAFSLNCDDSQVLATPLSEHFQNCNNNCSCNNNYYEPLCNKRTQRIYFSSCYAGCEVQTNNFTDKFSSCKCIASDNHLTSLITDDLVSLDHCTDTCSKFTLFISLACLLVFFTQLSTSPTIQAVLRCVKVNERSLGTSLGWMLLRLFGSIPGPVLFGASIDAACLVWTNDNQTLNRSCSVYNKSQMQRNILYIILPMRLAVFILISAASIVESRTAKSKANETQCKDTRL